MLRYWAINSRVALYCFASLFIYQLCQIEIEKRYLWSTVMKFVRHGHNLHILLAFHQHTVDETVFVIKISSFMNALTNL